MPNGIKYTTGAIETGCLKKSNMLVANNTADYGSTFYSGITPPSGGYTVYLNKATGGPSIYCPSNDSQLISLTNSIAGASYTTVAQCLNYFAGQSDKLCVNLDYEGIVTNGIILNLDAGFTPSYPTTGTTWYDLSGNNTNGSLTNGPTFNSGNGGSIVLDGVNDYINCGSNIDLRGGFTCEIFVKFVTLINSNSALFGQGPQSTNQGLHLVYTTGARGLIFGMYYNDADYGNNFRPSTGIWYHIVFTYAASNYAKNVYINGNLQTPISSTQNIYQGTGQLNIGAEYSSPLSFANINISIARIYNRPLTSSEILQNFNAQKSRFGL